MIEQLSKKDANPSNFSPQHIKNLSKTIEQNRATGQYLSTNGNTGENASINLLRHQCTRISEKKYQKPNKSKHSQFNQQEQSPQPNKKSRSQWNDNDESDHKDHKDKKKFKSDDCTQCGDYRHKEGFRCPASQYKYKICSKTGHFPKMCFFKDQKQQCIQLVQAHDDQAVTLQMSEESFHDANEENIPSDDDFVYNYMIHVQESSIQQKQQYTVTNAIAKFK